MRTLLTCLASTIALATLIAQPYDPLHPPDTYRNADNPYYWKNRPPYPGYWQQDVHYRIKARLDENTDVADGSVILTYWNNSPDTLREVFFHLYQNAYNAGSYLEKQERAEGGEPWDTTLQRGTEVSFESHLPRELPGFFAFIVVGLLLLATGAGYAKALDRARKSADPAPPPVPPSATEHSVGQGPPELP